MTTGIPTPSAALSNAMVDHDPVGTAWLAEPRDVLGALCRFQSRHESLRGGSRTRGPDPAPTGRDRGGRSRRFRRGPVPPGYLRLLRLGAVGQVIARDEGGLQDLPRRAALESPLGDSLLVFRVPRALRRAYAVGAVRAADGDGALRALLDPGFDPAAEVLLPEGPAPYEAAAPCFHGSVHVADLKPDEVQLEAELSHPGYVVLVDTFVPGWKADVDGAAAELRRANTAFRAVGVPAGRHRVTLRYRPRLVVAGLAISGSAAFGGMALGLSRLGRRPLPA